MRIKYFSNKCTIYSVIQTDDFSTFCVKFVRVIATIAGMSVIWEISISLTNYI